MTRTIRFFILILMLTAFAWPQTVRAGGSEFQGTGCDRIMVGSVCTIESGETLDHSVIVLGGTLIVEDGGSLDGDVTLTGGTAQIAGNVTGDIIATGGLVNLKPSAVVDGDISLADAQLERAIGARISGEIRRNASGPFRFFSSDGVDFPRVLQVALDPVWHALTFLFRSFMLGALAILVVLFLPKQSQTVALGAVRQPVLVGGVGLLTLLLAVLTLVFLSITIIGIPVALAGALVLAVAWLYGLVALGMEVGRRLAELLKQDWALPVSAGVGTFLLFILAAGLGKALWIFEWLPVFLVGIVGLGAVVLTRFGTQTYPPVSPTVPVPGPVLPVIPTLPEDRQESDNQS